MAYKVVNGKLQKVEKNGNGVGAYFNARKANLTEDEFIRQPVGKPADAGHYGGTCFYSACLRPNSATWYNRGSMKFYCRACAAMLSHANRNDEFCKDEPLCYEVKTAEEAAHL